MHADRKTRPVPGRFTGRTALVTGAARGIGEAVCRRLAAEGADLVVTDLDGAAAEALAAELGARSAALDHTDETAVARVVGGLDQLDVVVSNAGFALPDRPVVDYPIDDFRRLVDVNLVGHFLVLRAAAPLLRTAEGVAVVTASVTGRRPQPGAGVYGAAKAGLLYLCRVLALELAPEVRVVTVSPAGVVTPLLEQVADGHDVRRRDGWTPLGPLALPEDVAAAVSYLASDDARHLTGIDLVVDGGTITASA